MSGFEALKNKLENVGIKDRSIPFWSWNDKLEPEELRRQIREMKKQGIGGFFMHARGGLKTPYMSDEWMECIGACCDEAEKQGMDAWAYDEEGWPSGFGGGAVLEINPEFYVCWLEHEKFNSYPENAGEYLGVYTVEDGNPLKVSGDCGASEYIGVKAVSNPYYIDIMNEEAVAAFIQVTHEKYKERFGTDGAIKGFFTDEPQFKINNLPWGVHFADKFKEKYGYDIIDKLVCIPVETKGCEKVRYDYWNLVSQLVTESYSKQIGDWCRANNMKYTGHMVHENDLVTQMLATAGVMPSYEYFDIPGLDHLGRLIADASQPKQVSSVVAQLNKENCLSESFALTGWDISMAEFKTIMEWQYANGVTLTCQHLAPYSLRGLRKRDYPSASFFQCPWWEEYHIFNEYFARLGVLLKEGAQQTGVLYIHPMKSCYITCGYARDKGEKLLEINKSYVQTTGALQASKVGWHYGDETIMSKYGKVENGILKVGQCSYRAVVLSEMPSIDKTTLELLREFVNQGGKIYSTGKLPVFIQGEVSDETAFFEENVTKINPSGTEMADVFCELTDVLIENAPRVTAMVRHLDFGNVVYLANTTLVVPQENAKVRIKADKIALLDILNMKKQGIDYKKNGEYVEFELSFTPGQSYIFITGEDGEAVPTPSEIVTIDGDLKVKDFGYNSITLDMCEYRVDGGEWQKEEAIICIMDNLLAGRKDCDVELRNTFEYYGKSKELYLVVETPQQFEIFVNGNKVVYEDCGWWIDKSFKKINISGLEKQGKNEIILKAHFHQDDFVYHVLFDEGVLDTLKNKLTLDMEIESMYLLGDFAVYSNEPFEFKERNSMYTGSSFVIKETPETISCGNIVDQGFLFYQGKITLEKRVNIENPETAVLDLGLMRCEHITVTINGHELPPKLWSPWKFDIGEFAVKGENTIEITLCISLRNLLGPHHRIDGENYAVGPSSFGKIPGWTDEGKTEIWRDGYCFVTEGFVR